MKRKLSSPQILLLGFLSFIFIGTILLMLPFSTSQGISPIDALFTATSAVCVTGLIVQDTSVAFTSIGQVIILVLIQIGGLGYMTSATIISLLIGKRISVGERLVMRESMNLISLGGIVRFTKAVILVTFSFELVGAVILTLRFTGTMDLGQAMFFGVFHSISAFNNAGFSLFSDSLNRYRGDIIINFTVTTLIIMGGIGFLVLSDLYNYQRKLTKDLALHTKVVLITSLLLIAAGAYLTLVLENSNPLTLQSFTTKEKLLSAYFSSVTARTAGFNTLDYQVLQPETLYLTILLMFIGASPGSTGGGVKTTTVTIMFMSLWATMRGLQETTIFQRRIPLAMVSKAFLLVTLSVLLIASATIALISLEHTQYLTTLFEVTSAFGTVGLSVGDRGTRSFAALFSPQGKLIISLVMLIGRLGPLAFAVAVIKPKQERYRFPEGKVVIG